MKRCPFCGKREAKPVHDDGRFWIRCGHCGATGPATSKYEGEEDSDYCDWDTRLGTSEWLLTPRILEATEKQLEMVYWEHPNDSALQHEVLETLDAVRQARVSMK